MNSINYPKITVVTPVYNGSKYIEKTIKSVLNQKYPNLEYMIIDGGSTDGTVEIIKKYEKHLAYWVSEKDNGIYSAIQKGFDRATGDIMAWINSDDYYSENAFETVSKIFSTFPQAEWLTGLGVTYNENGWFIDAHEPRDFTRLDLLRGDFKWIQQESTFWRKTLWDKAGSKLENYKLADDFELWLRFSRYAKLYCTNSYLGGFRQRVSGQLSLEGLQKYLDECNQALAKEPVSHEEKKYIKKLDFWYNIKKLFERTKLLNPELPQRMINRIYRKLYGNRRIRYNRMKQEFEL